MQKSVIENKGLDQIVFEKMCDRIQQTPCIKTLGINLIYLGPGTAGIKMSAQPEYTTVKNRLHGGLIATLADTVMGWSVASVAQGSAVTLDMNLNYFAPVFEETEITAEGYVIHGGRNTVVAEAELFNNERKLVAKSRATFYINLKVSGGQSP